MLGWDTYNYFKCNDTEQYFSNIFFCAQQCILAILHIVRVRVVPGHRGYGICHGCACLGNLDDNKVVSCPICAVQLYIIGSVNGKQRTSCDHPARLKARPRT